MIRKQSEQNIAKKNLRNGHGEVIMRNLISGDAELLGKGRLLAHMTLLPGDSIGEHAHEGDGELFYILKGHPTYNDNGNWATLEPGDFTVCYDGESHCIQNNTEEPVEFIALILYSK